MPRWTPEARRKQAEIQKTRRSWRHSTGPKTAAGKKRSSMNAWKHGSYSALEAELRRLLRLNGQMLRAINTSLAIAGDEVTRQSIQQTPKNGTLHHPENAAILPVHAKDKRTAKAAKPFFINPWPIAPPSRPSREPFCHPVNTHCHPEQTRRIPGS